MASTNSTAPLSGSSPVFSSSIIHFSTMATLGSGSGEDNMSHQSGASKAEVYYHEGATPLFLALEESDWRGALPLCTPEQCSTWVQSTGTVATQFSWSLWKRLPLHEACRRQAPAWIVHALLKAYPAAAAAATPFGKLPLHLAVECGAAPEVVNLLLVSNWPAIAVEDQSGRTPLEILLEAEVSDLECHATVMSSLRPAAERWEDLQESFAAERAQLKMEHERGLRAVCAQHEEDLAAEQEQLIKVMEQVEQMEGKLRDADKEQVLWQQRLQKARDQTAAARVEQQEMSSKWERTEQERDDTLLRVQVLEAQLADRDSLLEQRQAKILDLENVLQRLQAFQKKHVKSQLTETQDKIQNMLDSFVDLHDLLDGHERDLRTLLRVKNISELASEEKKEEVVDLDREEDVLAEEAMMSAAQAASNVLKLAAEK